MTFGERANRFRVQRTMEDRYLRDNGIRRDSSAGRERLGRISFMSQGSTDAWHAEHQLGLTPGSQKWREHMHICGHRDR